MLHLNLVLGARVLISRSLNEVGEARLLRRLFNSTWLGARARDRVGHLIDARAAAAAASIHGHRQCTPSLVDRLDSDPLSLIDRSISSPSTHFATARAAPGCRAIAKSGRPTRTLDSQNTHGGFAPVDRWPAAPPLQHPLPLPQRQALALAAAEDGASPTSSSGSRSGRAASGASTTGGTRPRAGG